MTKTMQDYYTLRRLLCLPWVPRDWKLFPYPIIGFEDSWESGLTVVFIVSGSMDGVGDQVRGYNVSNILVKPFNVMELRFSFMTNVAAGEDWRCAAYYDYYLIAKCSIALGDVYSVSRVGLTASTDGGAELYLSEQ